MAALSQPKSKMSKITIQFVFEVEELPEDQYNLVETYVWPCLINIAYNKQSDGRYLDTTSGKRQVGHVDNNDTVGLQKLRLPAIFNISHYEGWRMRALISAR